MTLHRRSLTVLLSVLLLPLGAVAQSQSTGNITGAVYDASGAVVPAARVTVTNTATQFAWTAETSAEGAYHVSFLPVGTYDVAAETLGFKRMVRKGITLSAAETARVDLTLEIGQTAQQVTVEANATPVATETADVGNTVTGTQTRELPLSTRQFIQMLTLEPGVNSNVSSQPGFGSLSTAAVSVNGLRQNQNNYLLDGSNNIDVYNGNNMVTPNLEALSEFRVSRASFSAETGRSAGATVNLITRSGTNQFHGSAFEYLRNDALNARNFFAYNQVDPVTGAELPGTARPENRYNNFGYTFGGPIKKDKLFFFWSQEWRRIIQSGGTSLTKAPTAEQRQGVFPGVTLTNPAGRTTPTGAPCITVTGGTSMIDPSCIDHNSSLLVNTYFPSPNLGSGALGVNYSASNPDSTNTREELIRFDYKPTDKMAFFARYAQDQVSIASPFGLWRENAFPVVGASNEFEPLQNAALNFTYTFSPTVVNEFQYSFDHNLIRIFATSASSRTLAPGLDIPYFYPSNAQNNSNNRIPDLNFWQGGYGGITLNWPFRNTYIYNKFTDNITWVHGRHSFRFGGLLTRQGKGEDNCCTDNQNGNFAFDGHATGDALADMLMGNAYLYTETLNKPHQILHYYDFELYGQDSIKVRPNFTLNLGLRYSLFTAEYDSNGVLANFSNNLYSSANAPTFNPDGSLSPTNYNFLNGIYVASNAVIPSDLQGQVTKSPYGEKIYDPSKANFAPRLGFAWDLGGQHKTSVRGGYGIYYDRWAPYVLWMKNTPPFNYTSNIYYTPVSDPGGGTSAIYPLGISTIDPKFRVPYSQQWTLGVQHEILKDTLLDVAYVGTKGTHLLRTRDYNQGEPNIAVAEGILSPSPLRPYVGFTGMTMFEPSAISNYNALQVSLNRRFTHGVSFQAAYTWSKTITDADNDAAWPQNSFNLSGERGLASYDRPQSFIFNYVWEIPFAKNLTGFQKALLDGWVLSGITSFQSGNAYTVTSGADRAGIGNWNERADLVGNPSGAKTVAQYFNTAAFAMPALGTFGNSGVGIVRGPGTNNWDVSLGKNNKVPWFWGTEGGSLEFRAQFLNAWNHPSFDYINTALSAGASFGTVTGARDPRVMQFGLILRF
jgi:hypothetical protein